MTAWKWNGSRWWRFDFHTHTPISDDYGKGPDQAELKKRTPQEWLLDYMRAEIDCVAITDHNTGQWVDELKKALNELENESHPEFRPIYLFPGMEISTQGGIHVLAIFDTTKNTSDLYELRGAVRLNGAPGSSADLTGESFLEVIQAIEDANGIAIPAHVDGPDGLFSISGETLKKNLICKHLIAMELKDSNTSKPQIYHDLKCDLTEVFGSDSHHPAGKTGDRFPGSHFSWVKMGTPNIEGLRLALLDGALSVRQGDAAADDDDPNRYARLAIESIQIDQARYMGRGRPLCLELNPWLNTIIGGRGTGKSTIVEFFRLILRREGEIPDSLKDDFKKYGKMYTKRDDDGLLTENSHFSIVYRKNDTRFRIQWNQRGDGEPLELEDENGGWAKDRGDIGQRLPVSIYSQKQIYELAKNPLALLQIIDKNPEIDRRGWNERWKQEETRFLSLRARAREIESGLAVESNLQGELDDIKRNLAIFEKGDHAETLSQYQLRLRRQRIVDRWEEEWFGSGERIRRVAGEIIPDTLDPSQFEMARDEDKDILESAAVTLKSLEDIRRNLRDLAQRMDKTREEWKKTREMSSWQKAADAAVDRYRKLCDELEAENLGDPSVYGKLVQRRQAIEGRLKDIVYRRKQLESFRKDAEISLGILLKLRRELTQRRTIFISNILANNPLVKIDIVPYGAREIVEAEYRDLIQRENGFENDIGKVDEQYGLLGDLYCDASDSEAVENNLATLKTKTKMIASGTWPKSELKDARFASHMAKLPPETFDRLDMWFPEDSLRVQYGTQRKSAGFRPIEEGSPGQKTAALLAFLFSYGDEPIILDQPEDDLDNHLIYNLIVKQLRGVKHDRQLIIVTHNANIVVNGDAELVVALSARGGETQMECGSLQEKRVRETICEIMEGGDEAFKQRFRRIALEESNV